MTADRVLAAIVQYTIIHGIPPSIRNIADDLDLSPSTVHEHLRTLEEQGRIRRLPGTARGIIVEAT